MILLTKNVLYFKYLDIMILNVKQRTKNFKHSYRARNFSTTVKLSSENW